MEQTIFQTISFQLRNYHMYNEYINEVVLEEEKPQELHINVITSLEKEQRRDFGIELDKIKQFYKKKENYEIVFHQYSQDMWTNYLTKK